MQGWQYFEYQNGQRDPFPTVPEYYCINEYKNV